jgi:hypothetical protein
MIRVRMIGAPKWAVAAAIIGAAPLVTSSAGVADADDCGGFGPGIVGSDNCGPPDNNTGGGRDAVYSSWPPGMDWGSNSGDDGTPIVPAAP